MTASVRKKTATPRAGKFGRFLRLLGPGFVTGASDDDPSGIGTYSQAGAQLGYNIAWTLLFTFPLMSAIQEISARIGRTTGHGLAGNICRHYPTWLLYGVVFLLFVTNAINIGADLNAMGDALKMLIGGWTALYVILFGLICIAAIIFLNYEIYAKVLKWTTLGLFAYVATLFAVDIPWDEALRGIFLPRVLWNSEFLTTLVAILGTTISPYLFFWQASQEVEELEANAKTKPLKQAPAQAPRAIERIRADTMIGMAFSNIIAIAIVLTTAATLHKAGVTNIESSVQAADALRPIAGNFAFILFSLGIISTGLLAVPVLAGSSAYAVGEAFRWPIGLSKKPKRAAAFYSVIAASAGVGIGITIIGIDPIKALYWSAVINGVVAVPVMIVMMAMAAQSRIMGKFAIRGWLHVLGWLTTTAMAACVAGMIASWVF